MDFKLGHYPQTGSVDIWLHDLVRGTASRFTFGPRANAHPVWSPDGSYIAFDSSRDGVTQAFRKAISRTAKDEALEKPLVNPLRSTVVTDWSRDGRYIIAWLITGGKTRNDIWVLPLVGDRKPFPYLQTEFNENWAKLSPNGDWLAYASDESKRYEIYFQTFPASGGKWQISTNGGDRPVWSRDGRELYFIAPDGKVMAVEVKGGATFEASSPKPLFDSHIAATGRWFDVSKDGHFLIPVQLEAANAPMTVVINWTAGLKK